MTDQETESARNAATMVALMLLIVGAAAFLFLVVMVLPGLVRVLSIIALVPAAFVFHYLVWGWWLSSMLKTDETETRSGMSSPDVSDRDSGAGT